MKEISIFDIENIKIGNAEDLKGATGVTAVICPTGAVCGVDIRGGGPASRETPLLSPLAAADKIHAVVFGGGSAFGLDAAGGVMRFLEKRKIGFDTGVAHVPLVCQSDIFDLQLGDVNCRPTVEMGFLAAQNAFENNYRNGNFGAGTGATVGKLKGAEYMMKSGTGSFAAEFGALKVGAVVVVNALGDVYDGDKIIAGMLNDDKTGFANSAEYMEKSFAPKGNLFVSNTTVGVLITNAMLTKAEACKAATMTHNGYARAINPINTTADGDSVYAMSVGNVKSDINFIGTVGAEVMRRAVLNAVLSAENMYSLPCAHDF